MKSLTNRYTIDWGHLIFLAIIGSGLLWYLLDAMSVSMNIHNLLLIAPLSIVGLLLCLTIVPQCFQSTGNEKISKQNSSERSPMAVLGASDLQTADTRNLLLIGGVAVSLGAYVFLLDVIGFDIATWLFALAIMFICGERRPSRLIIYPLLVSVLLISAFRALLPFPMYTVIL